MGRRLRFPTFFILSSLLLGTGVPAAAVRRTASKDQFAELLEALRGSDPVGREIAAQKLVNLGADRAGDIARLLLEEEQREIQFHLEAVFRQAVWPVVEAWRAAVTPAPDRRNAERVNEIAGKLHSFGPPVWPLLRRLEVCAPLGVAKEAGKLLDEAAQNWRIPDSKALFDRVRYFVGPVLLRKAGEPEAGRLLAEHLRSTLNDCLSSPSTLVRRRAEEELVFLGEAAERYLDGLKPGAVKGLDSAKLALLKRSVKWRVWPELRARTGLTMEGWEALSWREQVHLVSLWKRIGGEDAIWLLKRIRKSGKSEEVRRRAAEELFALEAIEGPLPRHWSPQALRVLIILARQLRERGEIDRALSLLFQVVEKLPEDREARYQLAFTLQLAKRYEEAIDQFKKAIKLAGRDKTLLSLAYYNMACAMALSGRSKEAIEALLKAIEYGFRDKEHLAVNDPDLESLRGLPEFKKVLEALDRALARD